MQYDYLIIGSGLYGSVFARQMTDAGKKCIILEKRRFVGGNIRCSLVEGINIHFYGAHIFHTNDVKIWNYVNSHVPFKRYNHQVVANYNGKLFSLPFNMNTFNQLWAVRSPIDAMRKIAIQSINPGDTSTVEGYAISKVGRTIYNKLIKGYTEKQWGRPCFELPASIIKRIPLRFNYNNNYFDDEFQGIPIGGYNRLIESLLNGIEVITDINYPIDNPITDYKTLVCTMPIDAFFNYSLGSLEYRSLRFEHEIMNTENYQGCAVMNFTDSETKFTRIIEHRHFENSHSPITIITKEYPDSWNKSKEPFYPINDRKNNDLFSQYKRLAAATWPTAIFGGRLADYKYYDMHQVVASALHDSALELSIQI